MLAHGLSQSRFIRQFTGIRELLTEKLAVDALARRLATLPVQHPRDGRIVEFREIRDAAALRFSAEFLVRMDLGVLDVLLAERWLEGLDWFGELRRIACPTLLLRADPGCGGMLSAPDAARIVEGIASTRLVEHPGLGHNLHATDPAGTLAHVQAFLNPAILHP